MLAYFPKPYPDELFYSILCRLKVHLGITSSIVFSKFLYEDKTIPSCINFPVKLQKIIEVLPLGNNLSFKDLLYNNSMLNYFLPFVSEEKHKRIIKDINSGVIETKDLDRMLGGLSSKVPSIKYLRYCKECMKEDVELYGEPYYHRSHQIPGVKVCHKHCIALSNTNYSSNPKLREEWLSPLTMDTLELFQEEVINSDLQFDIYVARESYNLLNSHYKQFGIPYLRDKYITEFIKSNLATLNRHSNHTAIQQLLDDKIPTQYMKEFTIDNRDTYWLVHLTGGHNFISVHPLRLICLNYALNITMEQIFSGLEEYLPFGSSPWLCLNPVCNHYKESVINSVSIRTNKKDNNPLGVFTCPHCSYSYMRKGPDIEKLHLSEKSRALNYGEMFKERLLHLVDVEKESFNSLSHNYFDGMDGKALKMWYLRWKNDSMTSNKMIDQMSHNRDFWTEKLKKFPDKNRSFFQDRFLSEYRFCFVHDTEWFEEHFPKTVEPVSKNVPYTKGKSLRIKNWEKEDLEYSEKLKVAITEFKEEFPDTRASYALIEKRLGKYAYCSTHKDKMPISFKILKDFIKETKNYNKFDYNKKRLNY